MSSSPKYSEDLEEAFHAWRRAVWIADEASKALEIHANQTRDLAAVFVRARKETCEAMTRMRQTLYRLDPKTQDRYVALSQSDEHGELCEVLLHGGNR